MSTSVERGKYVIAEFDPPVAGWRVIVFLMGATKKPRDRLQLRTMDKISFLLARYTYKVLLMRVKKLLRSSSFPSHGNGENLRKLLQNCIIVVQVYFRRQSSLNGFFYVYDYIKKYQK